MSASRRAGCRAGIAVAALAETNRPERPWTVFLLNMGKCSNADTGRGTSGRCGFERLCLSAIAAPSNFYDVVRIKARSVPSRIARRPRTIAVRIADAPRAAHHEVAAFVDGPAPDDLLHDVHVLQARLDS